MIKCICLILSIIIISVLYSCKESNDISFEAFVKMFPNLSDAEIKEFKANAKARNTYHKVMCIKAHRILNDLGYKDETILSYFFRDKFTELLKRFQNDVNINVTGRLDSTTIMLLKEANSYLATNDFYLGYGVKSFSDNYGRRRLVSGSWKAMNYQAAYPINATEIECNLWDSTCTILEYDCIISTIPSFLDKPNISVFGMKYFYSITKWDENFISAEDEGTDYYNVINMDFKAKEATWISYKKSTSNNNPGEPQRISTLIPFGDIKKDIKWDKYKNILINNYHKQFNNDELKYMRIY